MLSVSVDGAELPPQGGFSNSVAEDMHLLSSTTVICSKSDLGVEFDWYLLLSVSAAAAV